MNDVITTTSEEILKEVGKLIHEACEQGDTGLSIAERSGVQFDVISGLRNGTYRSIPSVARIEAILKALGYKLQIAKDN